ncbi:MAG: hypothetical protein RIT02_2703 [Planctomycetota bacterium]
MGVSSGMWRMTGLSLLATWAATMAAMPSCRVGYRWSIQRTRSGGNLTTHVTAS